MSPKPNPPGRVVICLAGASVGSLAFVKSGLDPGPRHTCGRRADSIESTLYPLRTGDTKATSAHVTVALGEKPVGRPAV
eukprot:1332983-Amorphochlora_amoeboformis.AAC.1